MKKLLIVFILIIAVQLAHAQATMTVPRFDTTDIIMTVIDTSTAVCTVSSVRRLSDDRVGFILGHLIVDRKASNWHGKFVDGQYKPLPRGILVVSWARAQELYDRTNY